MGPVSPGFDDIVARFLAPGRPHLVPEIEIWQASELVPLWTALDLDVDGHAEPPYWAFAWPGSAALARFVLDRPEIVTGRSVLDVGAGGGLAAIACARAGAARVVANDVDPWSLAMAERNAVGNGVGIETDGRDRLDTEDADDPFDVVLIGDLFYARDLARRASRFVRRRVDAGRVVLIGEPGRNYALDAGVRCVATYRVPTTRELENRDAVRVRVLRAVPDRDALDCER